MYSVFFGSLPPTGQPPRFNASSNSSIDTAWLALRSAAQLPDFRMYDLRHHAITALLENPEVSEETVEDIAGHVSRRMKKRYSHIRMEHKRAAVEAIAAKVSIKKPQKSAISTDSNEVAQQFLALIQKLMKTS